MELRNPPDSSSKKADDGDDEKKQPHDETTTKYSADKKGKRVLGKRGRKFRTCDAKPEDVPPERVEMEPTPSTSKDTPSPKSKRPSGEGQFFIPTKLKEIYHNLHTFINKNPCNSQGIYLQVEEYLKSLEALGFRPLNCICCVCKYIQQIAVLYQDFEEKTQDEVAILEFIDTVQFLFRKMDAVLVETVARENYNEDILVTETSAIYRHIYDDLISILESFKNLILESISVKSRIVYPNREIYRCNLLALAERIRQHFRGLSERENLVVEDLTENRRYLYEGSYLEENFEEWREFLDRFLNE